jgi:hypothetical protein
MLHPHPQLVHLCEILKYKFHRIHDTATLPVKDNAGGFVRGWRAVAGTHRVESDSIR